jgi:SAM-dependent methyltransferase
LELGAYRHYAGHVLADENDAEVWLSDISARALDLGKSAALERGCRRTGECCAADFHDLPFADRSFDLVFIASAVHHSLRPELVLRELARVTRPGGLIWLENEPVGRSACLYLYPVNRIESATPYELALENQGLRQWLSSPFPGTRPEALFQMVENDRIPLDLFLAELDGIGETLELRLDTGSTRRAFEAELEALCDSSDATARVADALGQRVARAGEPDRVAAALGVRPPSAVEIWTLARRFVDARSATAHATDGGAGEYRDVRTYGAALQSKIRRSGSGERSAAVFRRSTIRRGTTWIDEHSSGAATFLRCTPRLPDVFDPRCRSMVDELYAPLGWATVVETSGSISLANLGTSARLPDVWNSGDGPAILLLRVYTVPADSPYRLVLRQGARTLADEVVAQAESRLLRGVVHPGGGPITLENYDLDGNVLEIGWNLRVSVVQILHEDAGDEARREQPSSCPAMV